MDEKYKLEKEGDLYTTEILEHKFGFRKWTWGEKNALASECSHINPMNGMVSFDSSTFNEQLLLKTVFVEHDGKLEPYTIEEIRAMDGQLGERLFKISQQLNLVTNVEAQNL